MHKEATSTFSSLSLTPFHLKTQVEFVPTKGERCKTTVKGRAFIYGILGNIPNHRKSYILIIFAVIL